MSTNSNLTVLHPTKTFSILGHCAERLRSSVRWTLQNPSTALQSVVRLIRINHLQSDNNSIEKISQNESRCESPEISASRHCQFVGVSDIVTSSVVWSYGRVSMKSPLEGFSSRHPRFEINGIGGWDRSMYVTPVRKVTKFVFVRPDVITCGKSELVGNTEYLDPYLKYLDTYFNY